MVLMVFPELFLENIMPAFIDAIINITSIYAAGYIVYTVCTKVFGA